ncbi:MAG TPA: hypothetical protein DCF68_04960 [Cyanothece sp. UBA12306]|nr:hypothetical protein [Cyanothece sp. UBA12306]
MTNLQVKLNNYPDWDREEQLNRNRIALQKLESRRQKILQITDEEVQERKIFLESFQHSIDQFRPQGSKLYSED